MISSGETNWGQRGCDKEEGRLRAIDEEGLTDQWCGGAVRRACVHLVVRLSRQKKREVEVGACLS